MKKLVLSLLCIGSILALPGCWCCRKSCEPVCEDYCDDYDDYCDQGHKGCGKEDYDDGDGRGGRIIETQQGQVTKVYRKKGEEAAPKGPRKIMYKSVHPVLDEAQAAGKECKLLDPRFHKANKKMVKQQEAEMMEEAGNKRSMRKQAPSKMMENEAMTMDMDMKSK